MFRSIVLLVGGLASLSSVSLLAQDAVLGQEYGAGVHAFFSGDYAKAYEQLSAAIEGGSKDPRAFYFLGLACLQLGRGPDAAIDFRKGADLESADVNRFYDVGRALERIQGAERGELETYRVAARMAALEAAERLRKARYEAIQREESRVLREQALSAPPPGVEVVPPPPATSAEQSDPFSAPKDLPVAEPVKKVAKPVKKAAAKAAPAAAAEEDPFSAKPDPAPKTKATPAKKGTTPAPSKKPADKLPALNDPFAS